MTRISCLQNALALAAFNGPFKTPLYSFTPLIGIIGMSYPIYKNSSFADKAAKAYIKNGVMEGMAAPYAFCWVTYIMKIKLFEAEPINEAITG